jgi:nitrite reductase (NO-forming)
MRSQRARRHLLVAGFVLAYLAAGGVTLAAAGACLTGVVVLAHAVALTTRVGRALAARLGHTVWFYLAASAALLAGMGVGLWLAGGVAGSTDAYRALRLAHVHLNLLGWVGLAVVGTQFTLWPTVLRTRMAAGVERAVRWSLPPMVVGLATAATGLLTQRRAVALVGLGSYAAGLGLALVPSSGRRCGGHPTRRRPGCWGRAWPGSPSWSWPTWPRSPAARGWWISMGGSAGWSRPWSPGSRCRP